MSTQYEQDLVRREELRGSGMYDRDDHEEMFQINRRIAVATGTLKGHRDEYPGVYRNEAW